MDPIGRHTHSTRQTSPSPPPAAGAVSPTARAADLPQYVYNAPGSPETDRKLQETPADRVVGELYLRLVKQKDLQELEKHIAKLNTLMAADHALMEENDTEENDTLAATALASMDQQTSNVYLGKTLHIICDLKVKHRYASYALSMLLEKCAKAVATRAIKGALAFNDLGILMFHLGDLVEDAHAGQLCRDVVSTHLGPQFMDWIKLGRGVNEAFVAMAFMGCVRACEHRVVASRNALVSRSTVDDLVEAILDKVPKGPGAFSSLSHGHLALCCRYGVQHLERLNRIKVPQEGLVPAIHNMARLSKLWIDEARMAPRSLWRADLETAAENLDTPIHSYLAQAVHFYNKWLIEQKPERQSEFALLEVPRQVTDNPVDGRIFSKVLLESVDDAVLPDAVLEPVHDPSRAKAEPAPHWIRGGAATQGDASTSAAYGGYVSMASIARESHAERSGIVNRFLPDPIQAAAPAMPSASGEPLRPTTTEVLGYFHDASDSLRIDDRNPRVQERFIACTNELIAAIEAGRMTLEPQDEARILGEIDTACTRLAQAVALAVLDRLWPGSVKESPRQGAYRWALHTYTEFMDTRLNRLLSLQAKPLLPLPPSLEPKTYGLSPRQRVLLAGFIGTHPKVHNTL